MNLKLRNRWKFIGDKKDPWWEWAAFLDDSGSGDLSKVESVEYVLHPTFAVPVLEVENPKGGFVLETKGWGDFKLKAFVHLKGGEKIRLTHDLVLQEDPEVGESD